MQCTPAMRAAAPASECKLQHAQDPGGIRGLSLPGLIRHQTTLDMLSNRPGLGFRAPASACNVKAIQANSESIAPMEQTLITCSEAIGGNSTQRSTKIEGKATSRGSGFRVQGSGCRVQGSGRRVQGSGCRAQGSGFRVQGLASRVQVQDSEGRVQASGFLVDM